MTTVDGRLGTDGGRRRAKEQRRLTKAEAVRRRGGRQLPATLDGGRWVTWKQIGDAATAGDGDWRSWCR
ncbi:hypothetical protein E2562_020687 [Oryza meyeriana var. granulata]|uniref:Uncharacterized protein n=1 Tax=Oryza meyeriana var. granulata TaxID=110450 RepID=A0A6G1EN00_9ORYZ|nr:hypothetical protein E2562_020687 [Oryza meyeriana var. granulata]